MENVFKANNFDLLRIFAATQVLLMHSTHHLLLKKSSWVTLMEYFPGVPIFFTISGYLISAAYERSNSLKNYFRNRFLRIYPGLWGCLFLTIIVASLLGFSFLNKSTPLWLVSQMAGIIYTPGFLSKFGFGSYNGSLWTIPVELQFYVLLPVVYWFMGKSKNSNFVLYALFFLFISIALACNLFLTGIGAVNESTFEKLVRYSFLPHFYLFLSGVIMNRLNIFQSKWIHGKGLYWLVGYLLLASLIFKILALSVITLLLLSVTVISLAYTSVGLSKKLLMGNDISYGVYIYHGLVLNVLASYTLFHQPVYLLIVLISAYTLGYASWILIEKPSLKRKIFSIRKYS